MRQRQNAPTLARICERFVRQNAHLRGNDEKASPTTIWTESSMPLAPPTTWPGMPGAPSHHPQQPNPILPILQNPPHPSSPPSPNIPRCLAALARAPLRSAKGATNTIIPIFQHHGNHSSKNNLTTTPNTCFNKQQAFKPTAIGRNAQRIAAPRGSSPRGSYRRLK